MGPGVPGPGRTDRRGRQVLLPRADRLDAQAPHLRIRFVVPITRDGDTAELHAWYDQVLFPDTSPMAPPESGEGS